MKYDEIAKVWRVFIVVLLLAFTAACSESSDETISSDKSAADELIIVADFNDSSASPKRISLGNTFTLSAGSGSDPADAENPLFIGISWSIISKPLNSRAVIENPTSSQPTFRPDVVGEYVLKVVITQGGTILAEKEITIIAGVDDLFPIKPDNHLPTTDDCLACHVPESWVITPIIDHTQVFGVCSVCHNGTKASGTSPNHIETNEQCDICHSIDDTWIYVRFNHSTAIGACVTCHDGNNATGKGVGHIDATDLCEACHFPALFVPPLNPIDHRELFGSCISCHNNVVASGQHAAHAATIDDCSACHNVFSWLNPVVDPGVPPIDPGPQPIPTNHNELLDNCVSCHNGVTASGKGGLHPVSSDMCEACHNPAAGAWFLVTVPMDHRQVLQNCVSCHNGQTARGKSPNHIPTDVDCMMCHLPPPSNYGWLNPLPGDPNPAPGGPNTNPVPPGLIDHNGFVGGCVLCHDNVVASGKPLGHLNSSDSCDACHLLPPALWVDVFGVLDHTQLMGTCISCH